jgi:glucose-6-phosphate 1-dehydrogenase
MTTGSADAFVFFGATGDLASKKIIPALQRLIRGGRLDVPIIGVAKSGWNLEQFKGHARESLALHGGVDEETFARFCAQLRYIDGDYREPATFEALRAALAGIERPLFYLAIPPSMYESVLGGLRTLPCTGTGRVVAEKPFGRDLMSAQRLSGVLAATFPESAIYRIDHFLGKEPVQNIFYTRFANSIFEPIWNRDHIASVQITMAESFGVQGRGAFYEEAGAIRDVLQNHLLAILTFLTMDAPSGRFPDGIRDEETRLLHAVETIRREDVVRGQFRGYLREPGVAPGSPVETFVAVRLFIDTWRWAGVPFCIRTGKCLPVTATTVTIEFKRPPRETFGESVPPSSNHLRFRLGPDLQIGLGLRVKLPSERMIGEDVELVVRQNEGEAMSPYERLLGDALAADPTLFATEAKVEEEWRIVEPILGAVTPLLTYEPGTWGPEEARRIVGPDSTWYDPLPAGSATCASDRGKPAPGGAGPAA